MAISKALHIALKIANHRTSIRIYFVSKRMLGAIILLFISQKNRFIQSQVYYMMEKLQQTGYLITFQWISNHSEILRNEKVDIAAKNRIEKGGKLTKR